jgi:hypothetical protein
VIGRICSTNRTERNAYKVSVGKPEERDHQGILESRWVDNIIMNSRKDNMD